MVAEGLGTALKPSLEPITVARKPLEGTVAANVLQWGTGGLNVDGCRVEGRWTTWRKRDGTVSEQNQDSHSVYGQGMGDVRNPEHPAGRWPANLIHDGSEEPCELLGDAARFFYCAKASKADRGEGNNHPTVKPTELMRYLCRLVTPPSGVVLDPFMGSGTTGKAVMLEGFRFIGIERDPDYLRIAEQRIGAAKPPSS